MDKAGLGAPSAGAASASADSELPVALEDERDFCLRSLHDLEAEREAGDIEEVDYQALRDSYTVRAAAALRQLDGKGPAAGRPAADEAGSDAGTADGEAAGRDTAGAEAAGGEAAGGPPGWRKRALIALGVVAVAGGAGWAVVASSATRLPGQEITGQAVGSEVVAQLLQRAQQAANRGDDVTAIKDYQKVLNDRANQPEALTGEGWLLAQTQQPTLLQEGLTMLLAAERAAPTYAPAHVYRGIGLLSEGDYSDAIPELQWYLAHHPDPQLASRVRLALQQAQIKAAATAQG